MKLLILILAALSTVALAADAAAPEEAEATYVLMPGETWAQAVGLINAQSRTIEALRKRLEKCNGTEI